MTLNNEEVVEWIRISIAAPVEEQSVLDTLRSLRIDDLGSILELELRGILLELVSRSLSEEVSEEHYLKIFRLVDLSLLLSKESMVEQATPCQLLEDLMDTTPTNQCWRVLDYFEKHLGNFRSHEILFKGKLIFLRACISLLRRYSRVLDAETCGRIILLLSSAFPPSERSGVNLKGNFHTSNTTQYVRAEEEREYSSTSGDCLLDWNLYETFWSLQQFLSNPTVAYGPAEWKSFCNSLSKVLQVMETDPVRELADDPLSMTEVEQVSVEQCEHQLDFVKYLTSPYLLSFQFRDSVFRRYHLVQYLIFLQHMATLRENFAWIGSDEMEGLVNRIFRVLQGTKPQGERFVEYIKRVLLHERYWLKWKTLDNCKAFERPPCEIPENSAGENDNILWRSLEQRWQRLYNEDRERKTLSEPENKSILQMSRSYWSWKTKEQREGTLKDAGRIVVPNIDEIMDELKRDKEEGIEEELAKKNSYSFVWKSLRVLLGKDFNKLNQVREADGNIEAILQ
ncbi:THO complex subunit 1 [Galdieria sulphuraria]|uniref:THO complex subunit 1 n=1 Tax=Galdieria sulphuraria TaxID=130081 RepID=M2W1E1_GALSU|nr:THO complex subunit 1 [Galdieria sulphuraria]EME29476.1 THO complex subunit 1 [Galdieria sulphuraria]|eukprot:XP_005705996.1 THO complex subunit 1 [Galdieria sulphuraria]